MSSKFIKILFSVISLLVALSTAPAKDEVLSIDIIAERVKNFNFKILENAERVYQAKEKINYSRRSMLPKINFWHFWRTPFDPFSGFDAVQDFAPYMIPANWFRLEENKLFYLMEQEEYRALWANEVMTAKMLFVSTLREQEFLEILSEQMKMVRELIDLVESRQIFGDTDAQSLRLLRIREMALKDDRRLFENLIFEEKKSLLYMMALPQESNLTLTPIVIPKLEDMDPIDGEKLFYRALSVAPELSQLKYLMAVLPYIRKEVHYNIMGISSIARALHEDFFQHIPISDGLGFANGNTIRIINSEENIIKLHVKVATQTIKKTILTLAFNFNTGISYYRNQLIRYAMAQENYNIILAQLTMGENVDPLEILTSIELLFESKHKLVDYRYSNLIYLEGIKRSLFNGDYSKREVKLDRVLKANNLGGND